MKKHPSPNARAQRTMSEMFTRGRSTIYDAAVDKEATEKRRRVEDHQERMSLKRGDL